MNIIVNSHTLAAQEFKRLGYTVLSVGKPSANGPDIWLASPEGIPISVEVKLARKTNSGAVQVEPVSDRGKQCDLIIILVGEYFLIEPMRDHLKTVTQKGYRTLTPLAGLITHDTTIED